MISKLCIKCKTEKTLDNFYHKKNDQYDSTCRPCHNAIAREKRKNPEVNEKTKEACKKHYHANKEKMSNDHKIYYEENKDKLKQDMKLNYQDNKDERLLYAKEHRQELKEKCLNGEVEKPDIKEKECKTCHITKPVSGFTYRKTRNYYESDCKDCNTIRERKRRANNGSAINKRRREIQKPKTTQQRIVGSLRKRLNGLVKKRTKKNLYSDFLGCNINFLMKWFEYIFKLDNHLNMTWDNYGTVWQIDHVTPCAAFDLSIKENQMKCFHWTNLCPVLKSYNMSKQAKIVRHDIIQQIFRVSDFTKIQYKIKSK